MSGPDVRLTVGDLDYWRFQSADPGECMRTCRLWLAPDGAAVGFAWPGHDLDGDGASVIDLYAHPEHECLYDEMLQWSEAWHRHDMAGDTGVRVVTTNGPDDAGSTRAKLLERRGWLRSEQGHHWYRVRDLSRPVARGPVPGGYAIRSVRPATDVPGIVAVNNRSGAGPALTPRSCTAIMTAPTWRRELHLVAADDDGAPAAFCIVWHDETNRFGLFEPVAVDPDHHRRGLGTAVMCEGLRRIRHAGATRALIACSTSNEPANRLYERLGFRERGRSREWTKHLT